MKSVSLFAGIAGVDLGFVRQGIEPRMFCENNRSATLFLKNRFPMFTIGASGAKSTSNMQSGELVSCIEKSFLSLTFPEPHGGGLVMVSQSLVFAPEAP